MPAAIKPDPHAVLAVALEKARIGFAEGGVQRARVCLADDQSKVPLQIMEN